MTLCTKDIETACLLDSNCLLLDFCVVLVIEFTVELSCFEYLCIVGICKADSLCDDLFRDFTLSHLCSCKELSVTSQHDIGTTSSHVGSDSNCTVLACLCYDLSFLCMLLCVEDFVLDALSLEHCREQFRLLDRYSTYQYRLTFVMTLYYLLYDSGILAFF